MTRIVLLGPAGAGKTTLAQQLGERAKLSVICLDEIWRRSSDDVPAFRALMVESHAGERWVSDGNFAAATFDIRLPRATLIVWLDPPRWLCGLRSMGRVFRKDSDHRIGGLVKVLRFIANFDRVNRPLIERLRIEHGSSVPVMHLKSDGEIKAFLQSYAPVQSRLP